MTIFDLQAVQAALYGRLADVGQPAAAAFRAYRDTLGGGSPSVIPAALLRKDSLPPRPFAAMRGTAVGGATLDMRAVTVTWWIEDDLVQGYARINALITLLQPAYRADAVRWGRTEVSGIGPEVKDDGLDLNARSVTVTYYRRG